ncbi:MAG: hypothetical protein FWG35_01645, partial [Spirochaetaceae bacterium]|nr:hypothetical protein [Spirochaetaceae bacterium]
MDNRTFTDIVEEALRLIPHYCPEWTNHNPADPGVTLIELFAWMTEMVLYRLGRVPEKTYLALLELLGLSPAPPLPARSLIVFYPAAGYKKPINIKRGTKIAAVSGADDLIFETERDICIAGNSLASCTARFGEAWTDYLVSGILEPFTLFEARGDVEHILYLASPSFAYLAAEHTVEVCFHSTDEIFGARDEAVNYLFWEYWDGRTWAALPALRASPPRVWKENTLYFRGPVEIAPCVVEGREAFWLRAVLAEVPENPKTLRLRGMTLRAYFGGDGFAPGLCFAASAGNYNPVDMNNAFRIFSETPAYGEAFYISADEIFCRVGIRVSVSFIVSEIYMPGGENEDARFSWEYWDGGGWASLDTEAFRDGTFGFRQAGEAAFTVPEKISRTTVGGEERFWIRVRLLAKDFSLGGAYTKDEKDNMVWSFSSPVHSPLFSRIRVSFDAGVESPQAAVAHTNFRREDLSAFVCKNKNAMNGEEEGVSLFDLDRGSAPRLYLGFQEAFPPGDAALYFRLAGTRRRPAENHLPAELFSEEAAPEKRPLFLVWEYWNGSAWNALAVNDYTDSFHESG